MNGDESDLKDCIDLDIEWLKKELEDLTIEERSIILDEYIERMEGYGIGIFEYKAFVEVFNEMED